MANQLGVNSKFPDISLKNENGELINLADYRGQALVVYFYPKDDTPGCTTEACTFRDQFADFSDLGAAVFGVSGDGPTSHLKFKTKHRLPFMLLTDEGNKVRKQLGIKASLLGLIPGRVTYIIDKEGIIKYIFSSQFNAKAHVSEALTVLKELT